MLRKTNDTRQGLVTLKQVAAGSKSERKAVVLQTGGDILILRREGGNPFRDDILDSLVGKEVKIEGASMSGYFLVKKYTILN